MGYYFLSLYSACRPWLRWLSWLTLALSFAGFFASTSLATVCLAVGVISWCLSGGLDRIKLGTGFFRLSPLIWLMAFTQIVLAWVHHPASLGEGLLNSLFYFLPWFWVVGCCEGLDRSYTRILKTVFCLVGTITSLTVIGQALKLLPIPWGVPSGFMAQPFTTGGLILISFYLGLDLLMLWRRLPPRAIQSKVLNWLSLSLLIQITALVVLSQRSLWLGLGLSLVVWIWLNLRHLKPKFYWPLLMACIVGGGIAFISLQKFRERLASLINITADTSGYGCRMQLWQENGIAFLHHPIWGIGKVIGLNCQGDFLTHAHNIFIQQLVNGGLIGFLPWILFMGMTIFELWKKPGSKSGFVLCLALMIEGSFENWWGDFEVRNAFWFAIAAFLV